jgi:hypothetical protein
MKKLNGKLQRRYIISILTKTAKFVANNRYLMAFAKNPSILNICIVI